MYCQNCGREIGDARFCPICGAEQTAVDNGSGPVYSMPNYGAPQGSVYDRAQGGIYDNANGGASYGGGAVVEKFRAVFTDPLFLVITILVTVNMILSFFVGDSFNINIAGSGLTITISVIPILFTIALWIIFFAARSSGEMGTTGFAIASGTLKAMRILIWVGVVIVIVATVLLLLAGRYAVYTIDGDLPEFFEELNRELLREGINLPSIINGSMVRDVLPTVIIVIMIVCVIVMILINVLYLKKLHRFAKSVCVSLKTGREQYISASGARGWLIVGAIFSFIAAAGSLTGHSVSTGNIMAFFSALFSGVAAILASVMIRKYFISNTFY